eukprot:comp24225_c0_seq1/m.59986 comp24225_c0_seq1/g.59986  ORF comp24225_c0_seq1/g.59986 comp24225_c0_seq1/m.59986 type:complete len:343 (-) comp24225_c0_seq1:753-1781(-)
MQGLSDRVLLKPNKEKAAIGDFLVCLGLVGSHLDRVDDKQRHGDENWVLELQHGIQNRPCLAQGDHFLESKLAVDDLVDCCENRLHKLDEARIGVFERTVCKADGLVDDRRQSLDCGADWALGLLAVAQIHVAHRYVGIEFVKRALEIAQIALSGAHGPARRRCAGPACLGRVVQQGGDARDDFCGAFVSRGPDGAKTVHGAEPRLGIAFLAAHHKAHVVVDGKMHEICKHKCARPRGAKEPQGWLAVGLLKADEIAVVCRDDERCELAQCDVLDDAVVADAREHHIAVGPPAEHQRARGRHKQKRIWALVEHIHDRGHAPGIHGPLEALARCDDRGCGRSS